MADATRARADAPAGEGAARPSRRLASVPGAPGQHRGLPTLGARARPLRGRQRVRARGDEQGLWRRRPSAPSGFALLVLQRRLASSPGGDPALACLAVATRSAGRGRSACATRTTGSPTTLAASLGLQLPDDRRAQLLPRPRRTRTTPASRRDGRTDARGTRDRDRHPRTARRRRPKRSGQRDVDAKWEALAEPADQRRRCTTSPAAGARSSSSPSTATPWSTWRSACFELLPPSTGIEVIHGGDQPAGPATGADPVHAGAASSSILLATDAAGEGVNLQVAHLMVNYDIPWNPNRLEQRFGRIHRIGQRHDVSPVEPRRRRHPRGRRLRYLDEQT